MEQGFPLTLGSQGKYFAAAARPINAWPFHPNSFIQETLELNGISRGFCEKSTSGELGNQDNAPWCQKQRQQ